MQEVFSLLLGVACCMFDFDAGVLEFMSYLVTIEYNPGFRRTIIVNVLGSTLYCYISSCDVVIELH